MNFFKTIFLVFLGGTLGTLVRFAIALTVPNLGDFPTSTFLVNVFGSFLIGILYAILVKRRKRDPEGATDLYRIFGSGVLGGFTTYSLFAFENARLIDSSDIVLTLCYGIGAVAAGVIACWLGLHLAKTFAKNAKNGRDNG